MQKSLISKIFILLLVVGLLFAVAPTKQAQAATITVCNTGGPCDYTTIQAAISAADPGDTIIVAAGTYNENLYINKALTLLGPNAGISAGVTPGTRVSEAVIQSLTNFYSIYASSDNVTIDGFTIDGASMSPTPYVLGTYGGGNNFVVQNNIFIGFEAGIPVYTNGTSTTYKTGLLVKDNSMVNATLGTNGYNFGMWLNATTGTVTGNVVSNYRGGIWVQSSSAIGSATVSGNIFNIYDQGIWFYWTTEEGTADWNFINNDITGIAYPSELTPDRFNAISVEKHYGGSVDFEGNSILVGTSNVVSPLQYIESDVTAGKRDATGNWWGSASGPATGMIVGTINYTPWCLDEYCTPPETLCTTNCYVSPTGSDSAMGNEATPFATIQKAVTTVAPGGTVHVAAGTYVGNVLVDKQVSIIGAGSGTDGTIVTTPAGFDTKVGVFQITGSGTSGAPLLLQDMRVQPVGQSGVSVGRFTESTGLNVSYLTLDNIYVSGSYYAPATEQERGFYVDLTSTVDHLTVTDSVFTRLTYGWYLQKAVSADTSTVSNVSVSNTIFSFNAHKGFYAEKLTDAVFTNCTFDNNGSDDTVLPVYFNDWKAGVDINLKAGIYSDISFIECNITNNGTGNAKEGVGIAIKARTDGTTYGAFPATLTDVLIQGGTITGNERGVRLGEPGKSNAGPTNVVITGVELYGNVKTYIGSDGSAYGDVVNQSLAPVAATPNWWNHTTGPAAGQIYGDASYVPWCLDTSCTTFGYPPVHNVTLDRYYTTIQAAMVDLIAQPTPAVMTDYTINVSEGTYQVGTTIDILQQVNKNVVLQPETGDLVTIKDQIRIDGNARSAGTESLTIQGFTFDLTAAGAQDAITAYKTATYSYSHNVYIKNSTFIGDVANGDDVAIRAPAMGGHFNYVLEGLTGTNLHSVGQFTGVSLVTVKNCTVSGGLSGLNLVGSPAVVDNLTYTGSETGVRTDANLTIKNSTLTSSGNANILTGPYTALVLRTDTVKTITIENSTLINTVPGNYAISNNLNSPTEKVTLVITNPVNTGGGTFDLDLLGGFGPISIIRVIDSDTTEYRFFDTIQDAINGAIAGDTINVPAGTYVEDLLIDKSVTLLGPNATINPNTGVRVAEAILLPADSAPNPSTCEVMTLLEANNVTIKGFTFDGDNPALTSGIMIGTADVDACEIIAQSIGLGGIVIENNILKNATYSAIDMYNYTSDLATSGNYIRYNLIQNLGETTYNWGLGVLIYNNFYADVTDNVFDNVRTGIQTGNYHRANVGTTGSISNNVINTWRLGIFHNLWYSAASPISITNNTINAIPHAGTTKWNGMVVSSFGLAANTTVSGNIINIPETVTFADPGYTAGYNIWNDNTTAPLVISGGTVTGGDYGVFVNNFEGYNSNADNTSVTIDGVTINGAKVGVYVKDSPLNTNGATVSAIIKNNVITATTGIKVEGADATATGDHNKVYATTDVENTNTASMNFESNYWGSPCGATVVGLVDTIPWFEDAAMLVSKETNPTGNLTLTLPMTTLAINNTIACAQPGSTITFMAGAADYPGNIIIPEGRDNLTIVLEDGVKIQATSPCFTVEADYTTIEADNIGMAACVTAAGSNGIDVADGVINLTVDGLEIYGPGNDGIHFNGVITDVVLKDNLIHDLAGNGVFFGAQPVAQTVGAIDIHGNMFQNNALKGIEAGAFIVPAEFNSWGNVAGAAAGDGASSGVDADPFTHVDLYLESSGTPWANQIVSGQNITYTVMGHLVNASGAEFTLTYPENLTYVSSTAGTTFGLDTVTHTAGTRSLRFMGYSTTGNKTGTLPLFNVTFTAGTPVVAAPMLLDELTDGFAMAGAGSSANIYAAALLDSSVTIVTLPTVSSTDIQGYYLSGEQRQFSVVLDNPSTGADYAHVYVDFTMTNAQVEQISLIEYSVDNGTTWVALGTGPGTSFANVGADIVGYFGKVTGGGFALAPNTSLTTLFRVTFVTRDAAVDLPTSYAVSMKLMDADALPAALQLDDFAATMQVYDKPTVTYTSDPYFIVGEAGNFAVTITNPVTGKNYANTAVFDVVLLNHVVADITAISCTDGTTTWDLIGALTPDGLNVKARIGGLTDGFFTIPAPLTVTLPCTVTYATAGTYTTSTSMVDVVSLLPERVVSADIPGTATVYAKPVITATNLDGPFDAGVPETVSLSIANASIPEPFEVVFAYPGGTVINYGGTDYTCTTTCPPISVDLTAEPTVLDFTVTFDEAWTGDVSVSLFDSDWTPADRLLASAAATGAVVNGDFAVTGTFSMQGRSTRAGIPVTLTWGGTLVPYGPSANTIDAISNNFNLTLTYGGTYTVTTAQPRYLNVTAANAKTLSVPLALGKTMNPLQLKAGNAKWNDNIINDQDSGMIASGYIQGITLFPDADVNFDNKINIQDLALVGGNYFVDSTVYNSWIVVTP